MSTSDVFIAHASGDKAQAEQLHTALSAIGLVPFLDRADIGPGDAWDRALHAALLETRLAAILVGPTYDAAFYLRDEVAKFIALYRAPGSDLRIVPVYLQGFPAEAWRIPYGLSTVNGLSWPDLGGAAGVAGRLAGALAGVGLPLGPPPPPPARELTRKERFRVLAKLLRPQFEKVQFLCDAPAADLPPDTQPLSTRAIALTLWVDTATPADRLEFDALLRETAPGLF